MMSKDYDDDDTTTEEILDMHWDKGPLAQARKNLNVLTNCHVKSLIFQNNDFDTSNSRKVIGINYFQQNLEKDTARHSRL